MEPDEPGQKDPLPALARVERTFLSAAVAVAGALLGKLGGQDGTFSDESAPSAPVYQDRINLPAICLNRSPSLE
jgi:hypothetical protein